MMPEEGGNSVEKTQSDMHLVCCTFKGNGGRTADLSKGQGVTEVFRDTLADYLRAIQPRQESRL